MNKGIKPVLHAGFTLIEMMIAITIMAALTVFTAQAIQSGLTNRDRFQRQMAREAVVRDTLRVMERDINLAYHFRDINFELHKANQPANNTPGAPIPPPTPDPRDTSNKDPNVLRPAADFSAFIGDATSLSFTSTSHVRTTKDAQESDLAKIGYSLRSCRSHVGKKLTSDCLWRRVDPTLDDDVTKGGTETVLLENVQKFKLRYLGPKREELEYVEQWKTGKNGDSISKDNFPYAVEISLTVLNKNDPKEKPVSMIILAPIRFPNNPPENKKDEKSGATPAATPAVH